MKKILAGVVFAAAAFTAPAAFAWEGQAVACYNKIYVPAQFSTSKELIMKGKTRWEHRNGQMVKMHYPPVYKENRHMTAAAHYVAVQAPCN